MAKVSKTPQEIELQFKGIRAEIERILRKSTKLAGEISARESGYSWGTEFTRQVEELSRKWAAQRFQVAIVALMKSGKSTLINAWLGKEFLPAGVLAETARIVRIRHVPGRSEGALLFGEQLHGASPDQVEGSEIIQQYLRNLNREARRDNDQPSQDELVLEAPLVALRDQPLGQHGFEILDTPGPNEYGVDALRGKVDRLLTNIDVVVYVLDVTKLKTEEEKRVLDNLAQRQDLLRNLSRRMFFVVNKIDALNRNDRMQNLTPEGIADHVVTTLLEQIPGLSITPDQVFLVSAENALLARLVESRRASDEQSRDFNEKVFGGLWDESDPPTAEESRQAASRWLKKSGLPRLEQKIISFLYEQRTAILFGSVIDETERVLTQVSNNLDVGRGTLFASKQKIDQLRREIDKIRKELEGIAKVPKKFEEDVVRDIERKFKDFKRYVDNVIIYFFSKDQSAAQTGVLPKRVTDFLGITNFEVTADNREQALKSIRELNQHIFDCLEYEFDEFWNGMVADLKTSYDKLGDDLTRKINPLKTKIEQKINETLNINLRFTGARVKKLPLNDFYLRVQRDIGTFVHEKTELNPRLEDRQYRFKGLKLFGRTIFRPRVIPYKVIRLDETKYYASSALYQSYLREQIDPLIDSSIELAKKITDQQFLHVIKEAQDALNEYTDRYIRIMKEEIKLIGDADKVNVRIREIDSDIATVGSLLEATRACRDGLEA